MGERQEKLNHGGKETRRSKGERTRLDGDGLGSPGVVRSPVRPWRSTHFAHHGIG